ncbi:3-phosphoshikimate 1-carboxyvinyltransferase [Natranaerobius trueperi]|uniref:3-phosphoshikimate 1-carboxyvinyltransferase n=1 Tax=Natranaerobius trueperi TaxID=759412 RepID=A0A226BX71_9FIRM|nr:3-phosphoshikimate 1-carboxyvinyltransferase [Natranaerobius trueperi]OWZ83555.1 3-phosphoshikimate 1-carboxyvinyltransferase [Natranaerobius trueperi]
MYLIIDNTQNNNKLHGELEVPGDKSISHRACILGAISKGTTIIKGIAPGRDVNATKKCLERLGANIRNENKKTIFISSTLSEPENILDAENSGTTARLLLGLLSGLNLFSCITGDSSLNKRPMDRVINPLLELGKVVKSRNNNTLLPATVIPTSYDTKKTHIFTKIASAQVKSALLLASLNSTKNITITEPQITRDHTERILKFFGCNISSAKNSICNNITIYSKQISNLYGQTFDVPGDISSAAFLIGAGILVPNSQVRLNNVGLNPTRIGFLNILTKMGAEISITNKQVMSGEPRGNITAKYTQNINNIKLKKEDIPDAIDELPLLAVIATQAHGTTEITGAKELRFKESDRIQAIKTELKKMGAKIEELYDGLTVTGPTPLKGAEVNTYGDHRIAMALAIAGLIATGRTVIHSADCIDISYPSFQTDLQKLGASVE